MRILITGVASGIGRLVAEHMVARGHRVTGVTQCACRRIDPRVDVVYRALDAPALSKLTDPADAVIHLAPVEPNLPESTGVTGLLHIANAAARSGTRLLFVTHAGGDPDLYGQADDLVSSSWGPTVVIRSAPLVGRSSDWAICRTVATLVSAEHGVHSPVHLLHTDDLCRFLAHAVGIDRTGQVDLATGEGVTLVSARRALAAAHVQPRRTAIWKIADPVFKLIPLQRDWGFECGWKPAAAIADTAAALAGHRLVRDGATPVPRQLPAPAVVLAAPSVGREAAPAGLAGEFDDRIDPRFSVFSSVGTSDALPGPLTPMTLDVQVAGLRAAQRVTAHAMALPEPLAAEWEARATAVFGHRVYTGVSVAAAVRPGSATAKRLLEFSRYFGTRCAAYATGVLAVRQDRTSVTSLTDAQLDVRIPLLCNRIQHGWALASVGVPIEGMFNRIARRPHCLLPQPAAMTSTGHLAAETAALAELLRGDDRLRELAVAGDITALRACSARFGAAYDQAVARVGHRGPGEAELANPVLADDPAQLLAAAALAAGNGATEPTNAPQADRLARLADAARTSRELAWDSTTRVTQELRIILREKGSRLAERKIIDIADDVFYLTCDEVLAAPPDARALVDRRRAERRRLQEIGLPEEFDGQWSPVDRAELTTPEILTIIEAPAAAKDLAPHGQAGGVETISG
jgi:nucleoside-diphosphate-sugar epimerase